MSTSEDKKVGVIEDITKEVKKELKKDGNMRGVLDVITEKAISRKLLVWVVATVFLCLGKITPEEWSGISVGYVGIEGFADLAAKWKGAGK